jgi:hypothetical protein
MTEIIERLRELLAKVGNPRAEVWTERGHVSYVSIKDVGDLTLFQYGNHPELYVGSDDDPINEPLAELIAESLNALPNLLADYERLRGMEKRVKGAVVAKVVSAHADHVRIDPADGIPLELIGQTVALVPMPGGEGK